MKNKSKLLLDAILGISLQKEMVSLQYAYLSTVMALFDLHEAAVFNLIKSGESDNLEQTIKFKNSDKYIDERSKIIAVNASVRQCINSKDILIDELEHNSIHVFVPIMNQSSVISIICLKGDKNITSSLEEVRYISYIYGNFYALISESERDTLTGLYNRRTFDAKLAKMLSVQKTVIHNELGNIPGVEQRNLEVESCAWLVAVDIDFFKRVNDQFGHVAGDEVLLQLSQKMKECFRYTDLLFRFGGEEFVIVLEPVPYDKVWGALERFRQMIEGHEFPLVGSITISTGFAGIREQDYPVTILDYADKALYFAKEHGRNCIYSYEQLLESGKIVEQDVEGSIDLF